MADAVSPEDERLARQLGARFGERVYDERKRFGSTESQNQNRFAQTLIFEMLSELDKERWTGRGNFDESAIIDLVAELDNTLRLFQFYSSAGLEGVVTLKVANSRFGLPPLF